MKNITKIVVLLICMFTAVLKGQEKNTRSYIPTIFPYIVIEVSASEVSNICQIDLTSRELQRIAVRGVWENYEIHGEGLIREVELDETPGRIRYFYMHKELSLRDINEACYKFGNADKEAFTVVPTNCRPTIDVSGTKVRYYQDADGDGYGSTTVYQDVVDCEETPPAGYIIQGGDCNDQDAMINPTTIWYRDADGDGYGDSTNTKTQCTQPTGYVLDNTDCDDTNTTIKPTTTWYRDADGDGYGNPTNIKNACSKPNGYVSNKTDCNDQDRTINPATVWYVDQDGDGDGNLAITKIQCTQPDGYVKNGGDCNDQDDRIGYVTGNNTVYYDNDGDGYGNPTKSRVVNGCPPPKWVLNKLDCNDDDPNVGQNCPYYRDIDQDGLGDPNDYTYRTGDDPIPDGYVANAHDQDIDLHVDHTDNHNYTYSITYDPKTELTSQGIQYYDEFGLATQGTSKDPNTRKGWSSVSVTDEFNRPAVGSLSAPVQNNEFLYKEGLLDGGNGRYNYKDIAGFTYLNDDNSDTGNFRLKDLADNTIFETKIVVLKSMNYSGNRVTMKIVSRNGEFVKDVEILEQLDNEPHTSSGAIWVVEFNRTIEDYNKLTQPTGTIPNYYKESTTTAPTKDRMDMTDYPVTRTVYGIDGEPIKNIGIRQKEDGTWVDGYSFTMLAAQEMFYLYGKEYFKKASDEYNAEDYSELIDLLDVSAPRTRILSNVYLYDVRNLNRETCQYSQDVFQELSFIHPLEHGKIYSIIIDDGGNKGYFKIQRYLGYVSGENRYHLKAQEEDDDGCEPPVNGNYKHTLFKTVSVDSEGIENVIFRDLDGNVIGSARSGTKTSHSNDSRAMLTMMQDNGYVDLHLPDLTSFKIFTKGGITFRVINLKTGEEQTGVTNTNFRVKVTEPGMYRFEVEDKEKFNNYRNTLFTFNGSTAVPAFVDKSIYFTYDVYYYDYAVNYYDQAGRLVKSVPPLGTSHPNVIVIDNESNHKMAATFQYNTLGQLIKSSSVDEGDAEFKYRKDGQIRYSQNSVQKVDNTYSFTDYDAFARPVKSGVCSGTFSNLDADAIVSREGCTEISETLYDVVDPELVDLLIAEGKVPHQYKQTFVAGNVSRTQNEHSRTWYSYDVEGKVKWLALYIEGLGLKTLDYTYDYKDNVKKVTYQK